MKFRTFDIQCMERSERRGQSPSDELLTKWGSQNHTVQELFVLLSRMHHFHAMTILKPFGNAPPLITCLSKAKLCLPFMFCYVQLVSQISISFCLVDPKFHALMSDGEVSLTKLLNNVSQLQPDVSVPSS